MRKTILLALALFVTLFAQAQPQPCGNPATMTPTCAQACVVCDIDGFTGVNSSTVSGVAPPGFCTTVVHNIQWISFIAGTPDLSLKISVSNCQNGPGLEIGLYQSFDCQNYTLVSNCDTDVPNNTSQTFTNTAPLTVGQHYYLVIDGNQGDKCTYKVQVTNGSTQVSPLSSSGIIDGPFNVCPGVTTEYTTTEQTGASLYKWTLNGSPIGEGPAVDLSWVNTGTYQVCVTASNACDEAAPTCRTITVATIPPTAITATLCQGECIEAGGTSLCTTGIYDFTYTNDAGCDSLVHVDLTVLPTALTNLNAHICEGDTLWVGAHPYTISGQFQEILNTWQGCDSTVNLTLQTIVCEITGNVVTQGVACVGQNTGSMTFSVQNGTPPFQYSWQQLGTTATGNGPIAGLSQPTTVNQLASGTYLITITDNFGNDAVLIADIGEAPPLAMTWQLSDHNGYNISCAGGSDGSLTAIAAGGNPPYQYAWNTGAVSSSITGQSAGDYMLTISDNAGCTILGNNTLTEPTALQLSINFTNPNCSGITSGAIAVQNASGGIGPYIYDLSGAGFGLISSWSDIGPGNWIVTLQDQNGCMISVDSLLHAPAIPEIDLGPDLTIDLSESVDLQLSSNHITLSTIVWTAQPGLSCYDCKEPTATPYITTTYVLTVASADNCPDSDTITINVNPRRNVYVPNVFHPDGSGANDRFLVFGGAEVLLVKGLRVYSRWGELVFEQQDAKANDLSAGWDGRFRGKDMPTGVYVWTAKVAFLDGVTAELHGDVTVVR